MGPGTGAARRALRVNTVELLRRPGVVRDVGVSLDAEHLDVADERLTAPVGVELVVTSTVDGIVVTGSIDARWDDTCRRCLATVERHERVTVDELYQDDVDDPDAFEVGPDALDLLPSVRDAVVLVLADPPPLCRADCAGLCPVCGVDRNVEPCGCDTSVRDERWAALDDLALDDDDDGDRDERGDAGGDDD